jgi:hypothetical protein
MSFLWSLKGWWILQKVYHFLWMHFVSLRYFFIIVVYYFISVFSRLSAYVRLLCVVLLKRDRSRYFSGRTQVIMQERCSTNFDCSSSHTVYRFFSPKFRRKYLPPRCKWRQKFLPKHWTWLVRCGVRFQKSPLEVHACENLKARMFVAKNSYFHLY